jgi:integrase
MCSASANEDRRAASAWARSMACLALYVNGTWAPVPKTPRSRRTIPLPQVVADAIEDHAKKFPPASDGTIFTTLYGEPYRHDYYGSMIFGTAVRAAGLTSSTTSHDLRHHYAAVLLSRGESVIVVAERLGHESASLVLSTYGHLMPDSEDRTRKAIDDAWAHPVPRVCPTRRPVRRELRPQREFTR